MFLVLLLEILQTQKIFLIIEKICKKIIITQSHKYKNTWDKRKEKNIINGIKKKYYLLWQYRISWWTDAFCLDGQMHSVLISMNSVESSSQRRNLARRQEKERQRKA